MTDEKKPETGEVIQFENPATGQRMRLMVTFESPLNDGVGYGLKSEERDATAADLNAAGFVPAASLTAAQERVAELEHLLLEARDVIQKHLDQSTTWDDERHELRRQLAAEREGRERRQRLINETIEFCKDNENSPARVVAQRLVMAVTAMCAPPAPPSEAKVTMHVAIGLAPIKAAYEATRPRSWVPWEALLRNEQDAYQAFVRELGRIVHPAPPSEGAASPVAEGGKCPNEAAHQYLLLGSACQACGITRLIGSALRSRSARSRSTPTAEDDLRHRKNCAGCGGDANTIQAWLWPDAGEMRRYCSKQCWERAGCPGDERPTPTGEDPPDRCQVHEPDADDDGFGRCTCAPSPVAPAALSREALAATNFPDSELSVIRGALASRSLDGETRCVDQVAPAVEGERNCGCWPPPSIVNGRHCVECDFYVAEPPPASPPAGDAGDALCGTCKHLDLRHAPVERSKERK